MESKTVVRYVFLALSLVLVAEGMAMNFGYIRGFAFGAGGDLDQDFCAAKALLQGRSIYGDFNPVCNFTKERGRDVLENFHPPITALLLLPAAAAGASLQQAFFGWGMLMMLIYMAVVYQAMRDFQIAEHLRLVLLGFALLWFPHLSQSKNGQLSTVILAFVFLGWRLLSKGRDAAGGAALGAAFAVKLFPGLLGVYLLATRRYRAFAAMAVSFASLQGLTLAAVGRADFLLYYTKVMPEDSRRYVTVWMNQSLTGGLIALMRPNPHLENLVDWPLLGSVIAYSIALAIVAHAVLARADADHRFWHFAALSVILCPVSWDHTVIVMAPLCILLLARFGAANKLEYVFAVAAAMLAAHVDDLEYIRTVCANNPKIQLGDIWQAKAQMFAATAVVAISGALLSWPRLAQRKPKQQIALD